MSFFVALFLALLLLVSVGVNVALLTFKLVGSGFSEKAIEDSDAGFRVVRVGGSEDVEDKVLRIRVKGAISEGASPILGSQGGTVSQVKRELRVAAATKRIKAVLLEIDSPGGGVTDSDEIHRLIKRFRAENNKPVLALFGDVSASGGYYIAAACDRIVARPTTITGSIGVIMSSYNLEEAMKKVGIKAQTIVSPHTPYKDIMSMSRDMRPEERAILTSIVEEMYQRFVDVVDAGRPNLTREQVVRLANGQIYSAKQAQKNGLVDAIADPDEAFTMLLQLANLQKAQIVEQRRLPSFIEVLTGHTAARSAPPSLQDTIARYLDRTTGAKLLYFWPGGR